MKPVKLLQTHIAKCVNNNNYAAKALLLTAVGLSFYSNIVDSYNAGKNKKIEPEKRKYIQTFQLTEAFVSSGAQAAVGLAVISNRAQNFLIKNLSKLSPKLEQTLTNSTAKMNLMKISSLLAAIVLTKRVIAPFLSTPIAAWLKPKIYPPEPVANESKTRENIFYDYYQKKSFDNRR